MAVNVRYVFLMSSSQEAASLAKNLAPQFPLGFIEDRQMSVRQGVEDTKLVIIGSECQYLDPLSSHELSVNEASQRANWIRAELLLLVNLPELQNAQLLYLSDEHGEDLSRAIRVDSALWSTLTDVAVDRGRRTRRP